jgi:hypothetical protein
MHMDSDWLWLRLRCHFDEQSVASSVGQRLQELGKRFIRLFVPLSLFDDVAKEIVPSRVDWHHPAKRGGLEAGLRAVRSQANRSHDVWRFTGQHLRGDHVWPREPDRLLRGQPVDADVLRFAVVDGANR